MDIRAGSSKELQGAGISRGSEWGVTWTLSVRQGRDTGSRKGFPRGAGFILHRDETSTRTFQPFPQHWAELRANPPPAAVGPTQREVAAVSQGSYSRCWGARAAAGPRSPSSRSFCRSGEQSPHRGCATCAARPGSGSPPRKDPPITPRTFPCLSQGPPPSQIPALVSVWDPQMVGAMSRASPVPILVLRGRGGEAPPPLPSTPCPSPAPLPPHSPFSSGSWQRRELPCPSPGS